MFSFNNTHIFTGYLKQLLTSFNLPTCKIYTQEFGQSLYESGKTDPRIIESFNIANKDYSGVRINYLKDGKVYNYFYNPENNFTWKQCSNIFYETTRFIPGLTRNLKSSGNYYDSKTHEYLGDYLRFIRDYYGINLMSLYNCFSNKLCSNLYVNIENQKPKIKFNSHDPHYRIYSFPVKLFSNYTIAIDSTNGVELFCGLYNTDLDATEKSLDLIKKTYVKINSSFFRQPFIYDKLSVDYWNRELDLKQTDNDITKLFTEDNIKKVNRFDLACREQDLRLFIKVPTACTSSIVVLEGDYRNFNDFLYIPNINKGTAKQEAWDYKLNRNILNLDKKQLDFKVTPISKLQLLEFNTGESYPFADRLVEYLSGSAITPKDEIADNIKRAQKVMEQNGYYFKINGLWEDSMQNIVYDYILNAGPIEIDKNAEKLIDKRNGYHPKVGHNSKSTMYDVLGYIDKDAEKWYASWEKEKDSTKTKVKNTIHNVDIYNGLFDE